MALSKTKHLRSPKGGEGGEATVVIQYIGNEPLEARDLLAVSILLRVVCDQLDAGRIRQRNGRLLEVVVGGRDVDKHEGFGIATQRVLQRE